MDKNDPLLSEALELIHKEGLKKILRNIGNSKVIAINALTISDKAEVMAEKLKAYWSNEKVGVINIGGEEEHISKELKAAQEAYDRIICLATPLQFSHDGIAVSEYVDCSFLHFNLGRIKSTADERIIATYAKEVANHQGFILSELLPEYMDSYIGELPKRRNRFRRVIKKLANRDLSWS